MSWRDETGAWFPIEHTPAQLKLRKKVLGLGF
jgi:hypothetical protein